MGSFGLFLGIFCEKFDSKIRLRDVFITQKPPGDSSPRLTAKGRFTALLIPERILRNTRMAEIGEGCARGCDRDQLVLRMRGKDGGFWGDFYENIYRMAKQC
jgi:hypothetical protein